MADKIVAIDKVIKHQEFQDRLQKNQTQKGNECANSSLILEKNCRVTDNLNKFMMSSKNFNNLRASSCVKPDFSKPDYLV